jgi:hypothetical protein
VSRKEQRLQSFGLNWFRRRQRALARGVLAFFCLAWLQLAAVPCALAMGASGAEESHGAAALQHSAMTADAAHQHCPYCPPHATSAVADGHQSCAYPHHPQVESRAIAALALAMPPPAPILTRARTDDGDVGLLAGEPLPRPPRTSLAVSFCRFLL